MTFSDIKDIITTVGFPIAVSVFLLWDNHTTKTMIIEKLSDFTATMDLILDYIKGGVK